MGIHKKHVPGCSCCDCTCDLLATLADVDGTCNGTWDSSNPDRLLTSTTTGAQRYSSAVYLGNANEDTFYARVTVAIDWGASPGDWTTDECEVRLIGGWDPDEGTCNDNYYYLSLQFYPGTSGAFNGTRCRAVLGKRTGGADTELCSNPWDTANGYFIANEGGDVDFGIVGVTAYDLSLCWQPKIFDGNNSSLVGQVAISRYPFDPEETTSQNIDDTLRLTCTMQANDQIGLGSETAPNVIAGSVGFAVGTTAGVDSVYFYNFSLYHSREDPTYLCCQDCANSCCNGPTPTTATVEITSLVAGHQIDFDDNHQFAGGSFKYDCDEAIGTYVLPAQEVTELIDLSGASTQYDYEPGDAFCIWYQFAATDIWVYDYDLQDYVLNTTNGAINFIVSLKGSSGGGPLEGDTVRYLKVNGFVSYCTNTISVGLPGVPQPPPSATDACLSAHIGRWIDAQAMDHPCEETTTYRTIEEDQFTSGELAGATAGYLCGNKLTCKVKF